jgi:hypothetical protein
MHGRNSPLSYAAPGALSMTTHNLKQRSGVLSEKMFGQEVHAHGDMRVYFFRVVFFSAAIKTRDASR